jgi:hypothetical protein
MPLNSTRYRVILSVLVLADLVSVVLALSTGSGNALDLTRLPVGDGKVSAEPKRGYVYACPQGANGVGGAQAQGPWIRADGTFDFTQKTVVRGAVLWPAHRLAVTLEPSTLRVTGNGLPDHATGVYPISRDDPAYQFDRNPNSIRAQNLNLELPAEPKVAARASCVGLGAVGVMLTGSVIYNALDATGRDAVAHETQDACQGHPDPSGRYHYHSLSTCAKDSSSGPSKLLGYALDGFGIYGPRDSSGRALTNEDLDECHGTTSEVVWRGTLTTMYHYVATYEYPYTIGCFRGTPNLPPRR